MNLVDVLIVLFAIGAFFRGLEIGFVRQFFSTAGFLGGLWLGVSLQPHIIGLAHTNSAKSLITIAITFGCAVALLAIGEFIGIKVKRRIMHNSLNPVDYAAGGVLSLVTLVFGVWLLMSVFSALPYPAVRRSIGQSHIVGWLNRVLPPAPDVVADIGKFIDPNGFPDVFAGVEPAPTKGLPQPGLRGFQTAIAATQPSVVRIVGQGCGGIVEGSGFVVGNNLVATNAHVVAGINHVIAQDQNGNHTAIAIWFDPKLDLAILRVPNLAGKPLTIDTSRQDRGTNAAVLGYPGGGSFEADSAVILNRFRAVGRDIYGQDTTERNIYELQANIIPGNSGGPLIDERGQVIGVIFAESTTYKNVGYALTTEQVAQAILEARQQNRVHDTGSCTD